MGGADSGTALRRIVQLEGSVITLEIELARRQPNVHLGRGLRPRSRLLTGLLTEPAAPADT